MKAQAGLLALALVIPTVALARPAPTASASHERLTTDLGGPAPKVSIDAEDERVREVLEEIADQAGWDLVLKSPRALRRQTITVRVRDRPADEVLEAVLADAGLTARLHGGILEVSGAGVAGKHERHDHGDARVVIGQPLTIEAGETVGDAVVVGGPLSVQGHVTGDAVAVGGPIEVGATGVVDGDAVAVGGPIEVLTGGRVAGDRVGLGGALGGLAKIAERLGTLSPALAAALLLAAMLLRIVVLFVLALLLLAFVPERVERVRRFLETRPAASAGAGLAMVVGLVPLCILLLITVVGIALIPVALFLFVVLLVMGTTALAVLIGERLPLFAQRKSPVLSMVLGLVVIFVVQLVPGVGTPLVFLAAAVAGGAALLSRFGGETKAAAVVEA